MPRTQNPRARNGAVLLALLTPFATVGCGGAEDAPSADEAASSFVGIRVVDVGFSTPESVLHDTERDVYLVSNINGNPLEKDGNGFISVLSPEGDLVELKWIDGEADGVTLSAPKGMAMMGETLFVTDIDCVRMFDRTSGSYEGEICVPGATFLNDIAVGPNGELFVSDTGMKAGEDGFEPSGSAAIHRMTPDGRQAPIILGEQLGAPNGLAVGPRGLFMVSFGSGQIFQVGVDATLTPVTPRSERQLDGIEFTNDGGFVFSSWGDQAVFHVSASGEQTAIAEGVEAPADIGYDAGRNRVLVPLFLANEVLFVDLE